MLRAQVIPMSILNCLGAASFLLSFPE